MEFHAHEACIVKFSTFDTSKYIYLNSPHTVIAYSLR
jgi:hypothetical protein